MAPRIGILGHFAEGLHYTDGQTLKTLGIDQVLRARYGEDAVLRVDTHGWSRRPLDLLRRCRALVEACDHIIILPAHRVRIFVPLLERLRRRKPALRLSYAVVGGWLPSMLRRRPRLVRRLAGFHAILVETTVMLRELGQLGLGNVRLLPNFRDFRPLSEDELIFPETEPWRFVIFSRLTEDKGVADAIAAILAINRARGTRAVELELYGPVEQSWCEAFERLLADAEATCPGAVRWHGEVPAETAIATLTGHFALLFPTQHRTEGIPGTIIDAYAAGLPVLSARWDAFSDVVDEGVTGRGYPLGERAALRELIEEAIERPHEINAMRPACLARSHDYLPEAARGILEQVIEGQG